jgi:diguanylate cyclase (GGDEF)-like protein
MLSKPAAPYDPRSTEPMTAIVRVAVVAVTLALFFSAAFNALLGQRDIAILLALATPLGISAWGFARAGHHEAAVVLLCTVLVTVVTLILVMNPLGVHDMSVTAYGGVVLVAALLLSRRAFVAIVILTFVAATTAFAVDILGYSRSRIAGVGGWPQYVDFLVITTVFGVLGRYAARQMFGTMGDAHHASSQDPVTGMLNRPGFLMASAMRLRAAQARGEFAVLVVADLDGFRRMNLVIGHQAAEQVLAEAARRLARAAGAAECLFGRVGDDELAVLALGVPEERAEPFAGELHRALDFDHMGVSVRNAAGFARFPRDAHGIEPLMLAAQGGVGNAKAREDARLVGPADRI